MNPINLFFRFLLELAALTSVGIWAYHLSDGWIAPILSITIPLFLMAIWGVFAVPNDLSRSGKTLIPTTGWIRILIEFGIFGFAIFSLFDIGQYQISIFFGALVGIHYGISLKRMKWLIFKK
jgi:hypothetical protein